MKFELGSGKLTFFQMEIFKCLARNFGEFISTLQISDEIYCIHGVKLDSKSVANSVNHIKFCLGGTKYEIKHMPIQKYKLDLKRF